MIMRQELQALREQVGSILDWQYEYETTHGDAGSSYLDCCCEPCNVKPRLMQRIDPRLHEAIEANSDRFCKDAINLAEVEPMHAIASPGSDTIESWLIGEIEVEIDSALDEPSKWDILRLRWLAERDREFCLRAHRFGGANGRWAVYGYVDASYDGWRAFVTDEALAELVTSYVIAYCQRVDYKRTERV